MASTVGLSSIRQQLLVSFLLVALLPLLLVSFAMQWYFEAHTIQTKKEQLYDMARERGRLVRERVLMVKGQAEQDATLPSMIRLLNNADDDAQGNMVAEFRNRFLALNSHYDMLLVNTKGKVIFTMMGELDTGADLTMEAWRYTASGLAFDQVKTLMTSVITPYRWYAPSNRLASFVATPVWDARGTWVGALLVQLRDDWLASVVANQAGLSRTGEVVLAQRNAQGKLTAAAPLRLNPSALQDGFVLDSTHNILANRAVDGDEGWGQGIDYRGQPVLAGWVAIPMLEMGLVVKQDLSEVLEPVYTQRHFIMAALLVLLILIFVVVLLLASRLGTPIRQLADMMHEFTLGRWHIRVPTDMGNSRELQQLGVGVNQLAETIEHQIDKLQEQATELEEQANELEVYNHDLEGLVAERTKTLEQLSLVDPMTGLFNRRHYMNEAPKLWRQAARNQQKLLFILLDVDKFKEYNDTQGHQAGDEALIRVAQVLQQQCQRSNDIALRMGGEEMAILSLIKTEQEAIAIAERILTGMQLCAIPHPASGVMPFLTVSIGLSIFDGEFCHAPTETNIDKLYALADAALYQAKNTGRNRAVLAQEKVTC